MNVLLHVCSCVVFPCEVYRQCLGVLSDFLDDVGCRLYGFVTVVGVLL